MFPVCVRSTCVDSQCVYVLVYLVSHLSLVMLCIDTICYYIVVQYKQTSSEHSLRVATVKSQAKLYRAHDMSAHGSWPANHSYEHVAASY